MFEWTRRFQTARPMASLPRMLMAAGEVQTAPSYRHEGRFRTSENHCLLKWTRSGHGVFRDAAGEHRLGPGRAFLCHICDPQTAYHFPAEGDEPWRFEYVCFDGGGAAGIVRELTARHGAVFDLDGGSPIVRRLEEWRRQGDRHSTLSVGQGAAMVYEMLTALASSCEASAVEDASAALAARARRLVGENLHRAISATDLAELLGVSREHLSRVFRTETSQTPYRYIQLQKVLTACRMLKDTPLTHKEIAARLGYPTAAGFCRSFRSVMHMPPGQFRRVGVMPVSL
ncbi:MAG: AraC family transcriptional regulator [Phycisphaerae bacterium]